MVNISINQLANEITKAVREYTEDVSEAIAEKVDEVANEVLKEVQTNHSYKDRTGDYTAGFKSQSRTGVKKRGVSSGTKSIIGACIYLSLVMPSAAVVGLRLIRICGRLTISMLRSCRTKSSGSSATGAAHDKCRNNSGSRIYRLPGGI